MKLRRIIHHCNGFRDIGGIDLVIRYPDVTLRGEYCLTGRSYVTQYVHQRWCEVLCPEGLCWFSETSLEDSEEIA